MGWCRKSASVVWQDKGSVTLHYTRRLFRCDFLLPPHNERVMQHALRNITRLRSCNVSTRPASSSFRTWPSRFLAPLGGLAIAAASAGILNATARIFDLRISLTDSAAPAGVYRLIGAPIRRGALVAACLPVGIARTGLTRGYLRAGDCPSGAEPVAKVIGALPGDLIELRPERVAVNGESFSNSHTAVRDSSGRPLPHAPWGTTRVAVGQVWLFGFNDSRSWDARYFGPVPLANVRGVLRPVVTW